MRQAEKDEKKIQTRIPFILDPGKKIPKKIAKKIQKIKKPLSGIIQSQNGMRQAKKERNNLCLEYRSNETREKKFQK